MNKRICLFSLIIIIIDQISKYLIHSFFALNKSFKIINNFFYITYVNNYGGAWSILNNNVIVLIIITIIIFILLLIYMRKFQMNNRNKLAFGLLYGGILGNLLDRVFLGYVRDFLDFKIFNYNYPVFNVADIAIVIGALLMGYAIIKGEDKIGNNR